MSREALLRRIVDEGRITFRDAMDAALNDPDDGWYGAGKVKIGPGGDFTTSPELSPAFGACVATWVSRQWERLGRPRDLSIVEFGAGNGSLALAMLDTLRDESPDVYDRIHLLLVERSAAMRARATDALQVHAGCFDVSEAADQVRTSGQALVVSNEFVDALPVHVLRSSGSGRLDELFLRAGSDGRPEILWDRPSTARIEDYVRRFVPGAWAGRPFVFEAGLDAMDWVDGLTREIGEGAILTIDYGDIAALVAGPHRPEGSLRAMRNRQPVGDIVGSMWNADLTVDVNFDVIASTGVANGWTASPLTTQPDWLVRMGVIERLAGASSATLAGRLGMKTLIAPGGPGDRFRVLELERVRNRER